MHIKCVKNIICAYVWKNIVTFTKVNKHKSKTTGGGYILERNFDWRIYAKTAQKQ